MLALPTVNINGTSRDALIIDYSAALHALGLAMIRVEAVAPHGRDYQLAPHRYAVARTEHRERVSHLQFVIDELRVILEHLGTPDNERG